ncbi:MAG: hypothetical protein RLZZ522_300 [Verrucomicrobiota bacterium]
MRSIAPRLAFIDALKAIASQLIVLHHLALYGPMSDVASPLAPSLFSWLIQNARIAVQVFLVIGGFLAARALAPSGKLITDKPLALLKKRYFKLLIPYLAAVLLSVVCAALARSLLDDASIPDPPGVWQVLAHVTLTQSLLGFDSLSAGVWYIAIDFQLFALLLFTLWLARVAGRGPAGPRFLGLALVAALALGSLFLFNRDSGWDHWALYFFGAYALGGLSYWLTETRHPAGWLLVMAGVVLVALVIDFRSRIAVALLVALVLGIAQLRGFIQCRPRGAVFAALGKISYAVFLVHFPVILVINAIVSRFAPANPSANAMGIVFAWAASIAAGAVFYRWVECRSSYWQGLAMKPFMWRFRTKP